MSGVLTTSSDVECGHLGKVSVSGVAKLTVGGSGVLVQAGVAGKSVSGCGTPSDASSGNKPCTAVASVTQGPATKLTVNKQPVMLDTLAGDTDGTVAGKPAAQLSGHALQTKLTAI